MEFKTAETINALNGRFLTDYPREAALELEKLEPEEAAQILEGQSHFLLGPILERLTSEFAASILPFLPEQKALALIENLNPNLTVTILGQLPEDEKERYLSLGSPETQKELRRLTTYGDDSAGRLMDPRFHAFRENMNVIQCLRRLRKLKVKPASGLFLVDDNNKLVSRVEMQDLALAESLQALNELAHPVKAFVNPTDPREEVVAKMEDFKISNLPVLDISGGLVGVVRYDALVKAVEEEATVDIQTMFGVSKDERALSSPLFSIKKRLPWLEINLLTAFLAASVVGLFEATIAKFTALAVLLPVVAGQSGNAGAQALAVTMRGLALREINIKQWPLVVIKEAKVGFLNGVAVALTTSVGVYFWSHSWGLSLVIGISMVISMIAAGLSGAAVPIILTRLGQDPATAASIILTTVTDVAGFFSFLGIATVLSSLL